MVTAPRILVIKHGALGDMVQGLMHLPAFAPDGRKRRSPF